MNISLIVMTAVGLQTSPGNFSNYKDCERVSNSLKQNNVVSYCVENPQVNVEDEMSKMILLMKRFKNEIADGSK